MPLMACMARWVAPACRRPPRGHHRVRPTARRAPRSRIPRSRFAGARHVARIVVPSRSTSPVLAPEHERDCMVYIPAAIPTSFHCLKRLAGDGAFDHQHRAGLPEGAVDDCSLHLLGPESGNIPPNSRY